MADVVLNFGCIASGSAYENNAASMVALSNYLTAQQNAFVDKYKNNYYQRGNDKPKYKATTKIIMLKSDKSLPPPNIEGMFVVQLGGEFQQIGGEHEDVGGGYQKLG